METGGSGLPKTAELLEWTVLSGGRPVRPQRPGAAAHARPQRVRRAGGRLRLLRLRRGRSGSGMAAYPVTHDPGKPSRPPPAPASLGGQCQGGLDAAGAGGGPLPNGRVEGDGTAYVG